MARRMRKAALATLVTLVGGLWLMARPAQAQGPYGRNSYEDFPFNQGSLFYRPLKPKPKPRTATAPRRVLRPSIARPPQAGYVQPYSSAPQQGYSYPTYPGGWSQPYPYAPSGSWPTSPGPGPYPR
jgi:hypothetical protein